MNLTIRILIGMGLGFLLGVLIKWTGVGDGHWVYTVGVDGFIDAGGRIFIASLQLMVVPLVLVSLICGAASLGSSGNMGRVGGKAIGLYLTTTAIAITIALVLALLVDPGMGAGEPPKDVTFEPGEATSIKDTLVNIFPTNPVAAMAEGNMLQIIVFALLFGVAISHAGEAGARIMGVFEDVNEVLMRLITILIRLAPFGVFCLMTRLFATEGFDEIYKLIRYFLTVIAALVIHMLVVYPLLLTLLARLNPLTFLGKMREPMLVGFSTASSGATIPVTLRTVEQRLGVKNEIAAFSVPLGATINMDGTAIMQGVATVFIAQFYQVGLDVSDYLMVILTATMASIGTAGVPGVGLIMLTMVLTQVGLPVEGIMLIIGVDRILDMLRTAVNVTGDAMVATVVARTEDDLDLAVFQDPEAGRVVEADD
ncbi:MAG: dicarboxylate/amino acid:cation symporter [Gammaproteobacteria bacterium]|nr:dicarboxylate/amino acid:cation symporter [Gammaproteobacteria bacterium]MBK79456.1 dicarboxylate/amino acid:cation symporter [Gammaproteobacteria bacterium]|tara:strand:+ start:2342 stop:3616 length:1275 start_codon:yes stop_codon:yes gene_type:complete